MTATPPKGGRILSHAIQRRALAPKMGMRGQACGVDTASAQVEATTSADASVGCAHSVVQDGRSMDNAK